jgi:hypothetical protein
LELGSFCRRTISEFELELDDMRRSAGPKLQMVIGM